MDSDEVVHKRILLAELIRRRQLREEQLAELGVSADPSIRMEIEDLSQQIHGLRQDLHEEDSPDLLQFATIAPDRSSHHERSTPTQEQHNAFVQAARVYRAYLQLHVAVYAALGAAYWVGVYAAALGALIGWRLSDLSGAYALAGAGAILGLVGGTVFDPTSADRVRHALPFIGRKLLIDAGVGAVTGALIGGGVSGGTGLSKGALWGALIGLLGGAILAGTLVYNENR
jgi:hypothetical protein